jgi:hypothetical protein
MRGPPTASTTAARLTAIASAKDEVVENGGEFFLRGVLVVVDRLIGLHSCKGHPMAPRFSLFVLVSYRMLLEPLGPPVVVTIVTSFSSRVQTLPYSKVAAS